MPPLKNAPLKNLSKIFLPPSKCVAFFLVPYLLPGPPPPTLINNEHSNGTKEWITFRVYPKEGMRQNIFGDSLSYQFCYSVLLRIESSVFLFIWPFRLLSIYTSSLSISYPNDFDISVQFFKERANRIQVYRLDIEWLINLLLYGNNFWP